MRRKTTVGEVDAEVLAYTAGQDRVLDLALVEADCFGTAAHAAMLARLPVKPALLTPADAKAVIAELRGIVGIVFPYLIFVAMAVTNLRTEWFFHLTNDMQYSRGALCCSMRMRA